jgi:hypothetical protein
VGVTFAAPVIPGGVECNGNRQSGERQGSPDDQRSVSWRPSLEIRQPGTFVSLLQAGEPFAGEVAEGDDREPDEINDRQGKAVAGRLAGENAAGRREENPPAPVECERGSSARMEDRGLRVVSNAARMDPPASLCEALRQGIEDCGWRRFVTAHPSLEADRKSDY